MARLGLVPDSVGVQTFSGCCDVMARSPGMMPPTIGVPDVRWGFAGTTGRILFPLTPANSRAIFSWIWTLGGGSLSGLAWTGWPAYV